MTFLLRRSLEVHPPDRSAWRQYFTLGEIFKAYGQLSDSILHLKQALALHPHYEPIRRLIAETEKIEFASNTTRMQFYTGLIIVVLVSDRFGIGELLIFLPQIIMGFSSAAYSDIP